MRKVIIFSSTTGNTEIMAQAIERGAKSVGDETVLLEAVVADYSVIDNADIIYLGSPAMGDEVLDDSMETFFTMIENSISNKKIAIFGSYDWGDGKWLRDWADRITNVGGILLNEGLAIQLTPDEEGVKQCELLGEIQ